MRDRLPNLWLLSGRSNASKNDMTLSEYFSDMTQEQQSVFLKEAMNPNGVSLEISEFEDFYEKRKALMAKKLISLMK